MINNINFKEWLVKSEAIEYQPENWMKFHRQMTNKFKKFEEKYTQDFFKRLKADIEKLQEYDSSTEEEKFFSYALSYVDQIGVNFQDWYNTASNQMEKIAASKCSEISENIEKYGSAFKYLKDDAYYKNNYEESLSDFESQKSYKNAMLIFQIRGNFSNYEQYEEVMPIVNTVKKLVDDFVEYMNNTKIVTEKYKLSCYIGFKMDKSGDGTLEDRSDFPPHQDMEYLYHATSNLPAILSQGFKYKKELDFPTGLGGGNNLISFTSNPSIAKLIASFLKQAVKIAKGETSSEDTIKRYKRLNLITDKDIEGSKIDYKDDKRIAFELFRLANFRRGTKGLRYDPWFGNDNFNMFSKTNINDIGVIKAKIDMSKVKSYHLREEEYRIPKEAIISFEKYQ
jgi:hypothetical protein